MGGRPARAERAGLEDRRAKDKAAHKAEIEDRRGVAYHEAGHAVACLLFGRRFRHVTIVPKAIPFGRFYRGGCVYGGHVEMISAPAPRAQHLPFVRVHPRIDVEVMINLAGQVAQEWGAPRTVERINSSVDDITIKEHLASSNSAGSTHYLKYCLARAEAMFADERIWSCVEAIAKALIKRKTLEFSEAKAVFDAQACLRNSVSVDSTGSIENHALA